MRPYVLCAAALFAVAAVALRPAARADDEKTQDEEKFTIKPSGFVAKGKSSKVNEKATITSSLKVLDEDGKAVMEQKENKGSVRIYVEKTLEVDEKANKRKKYSRAYEKAKDYEGDEAESKPFHGRTILFEESDGKWKLRAEGDPQLGESDLKELTEEVNKEAERPEEAFYPKKPVKVGDTWDMAGKDVAKYFDDLNMDPESVKATGKLVKAYKKGKQQWGTLEYVITFEAALGEIKKAKGELKATVDQALDASTTAGKATFTVTLKGSQTIEKDCKKYKAEAGAKVSVTVESTDVK
jgi:hypothetical protein